MLPLRIVTFLLISTCIPEIYIYTLYIYITNPDFKSLLFGTEAGSVQPVSPTRYSDNTNI